MKLSIDHVIENPKFAMFGAYITLKGRHWICYNQLQWHVWDNDPDTIGEIVLTIDKGIALEQMEDGYIHFRLPSGTKLEFASKDYELVRDFELERVHKTYELAKQIAELYQE